MIGSTVPLGLLPGGLTACVTEKEENQEGEANKLEAQDKITKADAQMIALVKVPGGIPKEGDIEMERGKLIWSLDITTPGTTEITQARVDALAGAIIDISKETVAEQE